MKKKLSFLMLSLIATSCGNQKSTYFPDKQCNNNKERVYLKYEACDLKDAKDYYEVIIDNSKKSNKVVLFLANGPDSSSPGWLWKTFLNPENDDQKEEMREFLDDGIINMLETIKASDASFYLINQSLFLKQEKFEKGDLSKFTYEQGEKEHLESVEITQKVVSDLKKQNKKIGLVGHLYGSIILNDYLAKYGDSNLDYALAINSRIKVKNPDKIKQAWDVAAKQNHFQVEIKANDVVNDAYNKEFIEKKYKPVFPDKANENFHKIYYRVGLRSLLKDYTKLFKDKSLTKTTYVSAMPNEDYGWLSNEEIVWLQGKGAQVKLYNLEEIKRIKDQLFSNKKTENIYYKLFNNFVTMWTKEQIQKYYLDAFRR